MNKPRICINGFGRIGRALFRLNLEHNLFDIVAINDINPDNANMSYLLKYDSVYGRIKDEVSSDESHIIVNGDKVRVYHEPNVSDVPWELHDVDFLVDSSGVLANLSDVQKCRDKIKNCIVTNAPNTEEDIQFLIFGVNEHEFDPEKYFLQSSVICDSISLSPIINLITKDHEITGGFLNTLHSMLSYQNVLCGPAASWSVPGDVCSHYALGRSSPGNIIPKSTSAIHAAAKVVDGLENTLDSFSYRVPTNIVCGAHLVAILDKDISEKELLDRFTEFEKNQEFKIIKNTTEPLTSTDFAGEEYSVIIDHRWTKVQNGRNVRMVYWYDNEWGYTSRVYDLIKIHASHYGLS